MKGGRANSEDRAEELGRKQPLERAATKVLRGKRKIKKTGKDKKDSSERGKRGGRQGSLDCKKQELMEDRQAKWEVPEKRSCGESGDSDRVSFGGGGDAGPHTLPGTKEKKGAGGQSKTRDADKLREVRRSMKRKKRR